jgi:hypothetical protein
MKLRQNLLIFSVATAVAALPAFGAPRARQTRDLLQKIDVQAQATQRDASRAYSYSWDQLDWMAQGLQLTTLKEDINQIGREVQQLQQENTLTPDQQILVSRIAQRINLMANNTQQAIRFGSGHRDLLWKLDYQENVRLLYDNATHLTGETHAALRPEA